MEGLVDKKSMERIRKAMELAHQYEDYVNIPTPKRARAQSLPEERHKQQEDILRSFESNVFNWEDQATKKPALDAFKNVFTGFDKLRRTFDTEQKEIVDETDFGENMAAMVGLMRQQI